MKTMNYEKAVKGERFYVKPIRGGYWAVMNRLDMSMESLEMSKEKAEKLADELNGLRK